LLGGRVGSNRSSRGRGRKRGRGSFFFFFSTTFDTGVRSSLGLELRDRGSYRGYSNLRTRTAPRRVLCSYVQTYRRPLGRCVSLLSSNPCSNNSLAAVWVVKKAAGAGERPR